MKLNEHSINFSKYDSGLNSDPSTSASNWSSKNNPHSNLSRLLKEAAYLPFCSYNKQAQLRRPKDIALQYPYMQVNRKDMVSWLVFDLDHSDLFVWEDQMLPTPNMIVRNSKSGTSHLYYAINPVCTSSKAQSHPIHYMKAIIEAFKLRLNADPSYSGPVAKTPGHPWWETIEFHTKTYSLGELADSVELSPINPWLKKNLEDNSHSRTLQLFDETRYFAYSIVKNERKNGSFQSFYNKVSSHALSKNDFIVKGYAQNLLTSELNSTIKSITRWTWDRYDGNVRCNAGVMKLDPSLPLKTKQQLSAKRTKKTVTERTANKLKHAYLMFSKKNIKPTQTELAAETGLSRQTVAKYIKIIENCSPPQTIKLSKLIKTIDVKSGTYKITNPIPMFDDAVITRATSSLVSKYIVKPVPPD